MSTPRPPAAVSVAPAHDRVRDPARLAALRALCLDEGRADVSFDRLTRLAAKFLGAPVALVNLIEHERQVTRSAYGHPEHYRRGDEAALPNSICRISVDTGQPLVIGDARRDERVRTMPCVVADIAAYAGVPLTVSGGYVLGSLCVIDFAPRQWTDEELSILTDLAAAATTELELCAAHRAAAARSELVESARRLQAVEQISDVALTQGTLDATLAAILGRLRDLLRADTATVLLLSADGATLDVRASLGLEVEVQQGVSVPVGQGIAGRIAASREPAIVNDVPAANPASAILRENVRSLLGAPLLLEGALIGVVHVGTYAARAFDEDDVRLLTLAGGRLSASIERARMFDAERAARLAAEAASRAKSEFLAVMSHELRTPLNVIGGHAQLIESETLGPISAAQRRSVERIRAGQDRLTRSIDDILRWAELDRAAAPAAPTPTPLAPVFDAVATRCAAAAAAARLDADVAPAPPSVGVFGDPAIITDILTRLVENAVKFTPAGGRVSLRCDVADDRVAVHVADTGVGIPEARLTSVFEPFEQVDASYRRAFEGLGLGLAIARAEALRIDAELTVQRGAAGGTVMTLALRRAAPPATDA